MTTREAYEAEYKRMFACNAPPEGFGDVLWRVWKEADRQARDACIKICQRQKYRAAEHGHEYGTAAGCETAIRATIDPAPAGGIAAVRPAPPQPPSTPG